MSGLIEPGDAITITTLSRRLREAPDADLAPEASARRAPLYAGLPEPDMRCDRIAAQWEILRRTAVADVPPCGQPET